MKKQAPLLFIKLCLMGAFFLISIYAIGQAEQTARYEREHKNSDTEFIIFSLGEQGVALIHDLDQYHEGKKLWEVTLLDSNLAESWKLEMEIETRSRLVGYEHRDNFIYVLFRGGDHEGSDLNLITIHLKTEEIKRFNIKQEVTFKVTHFSALSQAIVLGGYVSNDPAVLIYDLETENLKIVPGFFISQTELLDLRSNANNTFNALLIDRNSKDKKRLILKTFDAKGAMLFDDIIEIDGKRSILSGITSTLKNDELLIAGTWTLGTSKQASGIYSVLADPFSDQPIKFYDFGSLEHFLDYQSPKRVAKLKEKSLQAKDARVIPDFKVYTTVIRMEEQPGGFALLAEVYQPSSNYNTTPYWSGFSPNPYYYGSGYSPYGYYNPFMNRYYSPPYQYNNAPSQVGESKILSSSVLVFDHQGNLKNDYSLVLQEKKSNGLEQTADFIFNKDEIAIAYKKEKEILIMHGTNGNQYDTLHTTLENPGELVRSDSENSYVRFWYQNYMYSWGYQRIKDPEKKSEDQTRNVFYITKIRVD